MHKEARSSTLDEKYDPRMNCSSWRRMAMKQNADPLRAGAIADNNGG